MTNDLIDRQAAIDALAKAVPYAIYDESTESYTNGLTDAYNLILQLPSVQSEIIRCKDCENWQTDWSYRDIGGTVEYHYCAVMDVATPCDGYCYQGERKYD